MADGGNNWDQKRACAFLYALSLRLNQCQQICSYPRVTGLYYDLHSHVDPDGGQPLIDDCRELLSKWQHRPAAIYKELRRLTEGVVGTATVMDPLVRVSDLTDQLAHDEPADEWLVDVEVASRVMQSDDLAKREAVCKAAVASLRQFAAVLDREHGVDVFESWMELGQLIAQFELEEERALAGSDEETEPEHWDGFSPVYFGDVEIIAFPRRREITQAVKQHCRLLGIKLDKLCPAVDEQNVDQQEIIDLQYIPTAFVGWFQVEAGLWPLVYGRRENRPCAARDTLFVKWKQDARAKQPNKLVLNRWNELAEKKRQKIAPNCWRTISLETVKDVLAAAELRIKADQLDRLRRIY